MIWPPAPGRLRLQRLFSTFPDRWPGIGLVFLRFAIAVSALVAGLQRFSVPACWLTLAHLGGIADIIVAALLLLGFLTPIAGLLFAVQSLVSLVTIMISANVIVGNAAAFAEILFISAAIVVLGPGAFSLDAFCFGRREIIIPARANQSHE